MIVSIERGLDGYVFLQKLALQKLSQSARMQAIAESVKCIGSRAIIQKMLIDKRPTSSELLQDTLIVTLQSLMLSQTPLRSELDGLIACLGFANKNKSLIAFLCILKRSDTNILAQLNQVQVQEVMIRFIELLVICLAQSQEYDALCLKGVRWVIENSQSIQLVDFRLSGGVPLLILVCKRDQNLALKLLEKFSSKTLQQIGKMCGLTAAEVPKTEFDFEGEELMKQLCLENTLMSCNQNSICVNQSMLARYTSINYNKGYLCRTCSQKICHVCTQAHEPH